MNHFVSVLRTANSGGKTWVKHQQEKMKKQYLKPTVWMDEIQMEEGIAATSANTRPQDEMNTISEEWHQEEDQNKEFDWNF